MKSEFIEYEGKTIPYKASDICFCLSDFARKYILKERSCIKNIDVDVRDAILVDLINYLGMIGYIDFALYSKDLYDKDKTHCYVEPQCLMSAIYKNLSYYLFYKNPGNSIKLNNHMNCCKGEVNFNEISLVVLDFINYLFEVNGYDRVLSLFEMKCYADQIAYNIDMNKLKDFLISTDEYSNLLVNGEDIVKLYRSVSKQYKLNYIDQNDVYHYVPNVANKVGRSEMYSWDLAIVKEKLYSMMYAYGKIFPGEEPKNEALVRILKSMRTRE